MRASGAASCRRWPRNPRLRDRLQELQQFIDNRVALEVRPQVERFYADLEFRLKVRAERLPQINQWLAARADTREEPSSRSTNRR